jgi:endonuclease YncB( thermonuclease family)
MHSKHPPRNRLAKVLPERFRTQLRDAGVPKRKYAAILRATLTDGRVIEEMIVEEGWIVALDRTGLAGTFERRVDLDVRDLDSIEILQVI